MPLFLLFISENSIKYEIGKLVLQAAYWIKRKMGNFKTIGSIIESLIGSFKKNNIVK